jgi:16S rRNA (guanine527-N7)-methyltransferase
VPGSTLTETLEAAQRKGFLGPTGVDRQIQHGRDLATAIGAFESRFLDLGSGGGLPGLVLAEMWPRAHGVLLDAQTRRCVFLADAITKLGWEARVDVVCGRAEVLARDAELRGHFALVVARSFGAPAVTAECGVGFLEAGGHLVVTEPPRAADGCGGDQRDSGGERWPETGLAELGLRLVGEIRSGSSGAALLELGGTVDERWPRRDGIPTKRPLWR